MTTPNSLEPPRLATWLLERFSPAGKKAPLAGDLIEGFKQGRSSSWYWRQVLWVIGMAFVNLLRKQWGSSAYAVGCGGLVSATSFFTFGTFGGRGSALPRVLALFAQGYRIPWPWSLVYQIAFFAAFQAVIVTFALGAYFAFSRTLRKRNLLRALVIVLIALGSGNAALPFLFVAFSSIGLRLGYAWFVLFAIPTVVAVLLGTWQANLGELEILETAESSATPKPLPKS